MARIHSIIAACLLTTTLAFGQIRFGVQGSGQITHLAYREPADVPTGVVSFADYLKPRIVFRAGVMAAIPITGKLSVRPQLLYSVKGVNIDFGALSNQVGVDLTRFNSRLNYKYLELPVQVMYGIKAGPGQVVMGAGPYIAYLLDASETMTGGSGQTIKAGLANEKRLDYGLNASVGYELATGLTVSVYYSFQLGSLAADSPVNPTGNSTLIGIAAQHHVYGLSLGYFFGSVK